MERRSFLGAVAPLVLAPAISSQEEPQREVDLERLRLCSLFVNTSFLLRHPGGGYSEGEWTVSSVYHRRSMNIMSIYNKF